MILPACTDLVQEGRALPSEERGSTTTTVLVMPVLMFMVLLVVQFAVAYHSQQVAIAAAEDGLRAAQAEGARPGVAAAEARASVARNGSTVLDDVAVFVSPGADRIRVEVSGAAPSLLFGWRPRVSGAAQGPMERFRPQGGS